MTGPDPGTLRSYQGFVFRFAPGRRSAIEHLATVIPREILWGRSGGALFRPLDRTHTLDRIPSLDRLVRRPEGCSAMATVTRADLTDAVYKEIGLPRRDAAALVDTVIEMIAERLEAGEDVKISSFARFTVRERGLCCSASSFDPSELTEIKTLPR